MSEFIDYSRRIMCEVPGLKEVMSESRLREIITDAPKPVHEERFQYFLSDGTCVCRYCGSALGDAWEDK